MTERTRSNTKLANNERDRYNASKTLDDASRAMIFDGVTLNQMVQMFHMDSRTLIRRLHGVKPVGRRNGGDIYLIHEVVPHLWKPSTQQVEEAIRRMNHHDLPKLLTKEYWAGLNSKQNYELKRGDLWPTAVVVEKVGEVYKLVKMSALLMTDAVERQTELTDKQRNIIRQLTRSMLEQLAREIQTNFKMPEPEFQPRPEEDDDEDL